MCSGTYLEQAVDWREHSFITNVNAYYSPNLNSMEIPAAIIQTPFFSNELPMYLNLATMGTVVGHELTHGFDDMGRQFDAGGRLKDWWGKESLAEFNRKKQCIIDQYGAFNDTKQTLLKVDGINVQGEAIADNGGLKLAYRAFKHLGNNIHEPSLPGLEQYTTEQMFFIAFSNIWCAKYRTEYLKVFIMPDSHPPSEFRVKGALQNFQPFSEAFSCSPGSEMNPENKCVVW